MDLNWLPDLGHWSPATYGAASNVGTLVVAGVATFIARRQLKQARELREEEAAPFVVVDVVPSRNGFSLDLVIENIGKTLATDVRIAFDPPISSTLDGSGYDLADWSPLKEGIATLAPGRRLMALFDTGPQRYQAKLPLRYDVVVTCKDSRGRQQPPLPYVADLNLIYGRMYVAEKGVDEAVKELEGIRKALDPITKGSLTVEVYDGEAMDAKRDEAREENRRRHLEFEQHRADALAREQVAGEAAPLEGPSTSSDGPSGAS